MEVSQHPVKLHLELSSLGMAQGMALHFSFMFYVCKLLEILFIVFRHIEYRECNF